MAAKLEKALIDGFAGLILCSAWAVWLRFFAFSKTGFAVGWDSYFYLVNLRAWVETGKMHAPEATLVYPFLRATHWFSGDYESSIKISSALLAGFFVFAVGVFSKNWGGPRAWVLPVAAAVFSPHLTWFASQFPKNLLGAGLLVLAVGFLKKSRRAAAFLIALGFFGHRLTFVLAVGWAVVFFFFEQKWAKKWRSRRFVWGLLAAAFLLVLASKKMPGLLVAADLERLAGIFDFRKMQFAPRSFWLDLEAVGALHFLWKLEILTNAGLFGYAVFRFIFDQKSLDSSQKSLVLLFAALLWPFLEWSATGLGLRLFAMFGLLAPLLFLSAAPSFARTTAAVFFMLASFFSAQNFDPKKHSPDFAAYEKVAARAAEKLKNRPVELVIAHNGLAEFFEFRTHLEAMPWQPEYAIDSSKLWRLATGLREPFLTQTLDNEQLMRVEKLPHGYFLMPDAVFQNLLKKARAAGDDDFLAEILTWRNPHLERPAWLLARKKNR